MGDGEGGGGAKYKKNICARENEINPKKFMRRPKKNSYKEFDNDPPSPAITFLMVHPVLYGEKADRLSSVSWKDTPHVEITDGVQGVLKVRSSTL